MSECVTSVPGDWFGSYENPLHFDKANDEWQVSVSIAGLYGAADLDEQARILARLASALRVLNGWER